MSAVPSIQLPGGQTMPMIGFGTWSVWQDSDDIVYQSVKSALEVGYRHIDCAFVYNNEEAIGRAIKEALDSGYLTRKDLFVTTKVWNTHHGRERTQVGLQKSLAWLGLDYVDLYLIHWPCAFQAGDVNFPKDADGNIILDTEKTLEDTWAGMEKCVDLGLAKTIGISNFNRQQTERILKVARVKPACVQAEIHVYHSNTALVEYCRSNGMVVTAFGPLGSPNRPWLGSDQVSCLKDPEVQRIATARGRTPAQVCLRYLIQLGLAVIPKSANPKRIRENFQIFDFTLSDDDMTKLKALNKNNRVYKEEIALAHPEYPFHVEY